MGQKIKKAIFQDRIPEDLRTSGHFNEQFIYVKFVVTLPKFWENSFLIGYLRHAKNTFSKFQVLIRQSIIQERVPILYV